MIDDPAIQPSHIHFEIKKSGGLWIKPADRAALILVNGRSIGEGGELPLEAMVQFGASRLIVTNFALTLPPSKRLRKAKFESGSAERAILDIIEKESLEIDPEFL